MNDTDPTFASYDRYREALGEASESNKTVVFDALLAANITSVVVEFDGAGDSGQIESITAYRGEEQIDLSATTITMQQATWGSTELRTTEEKLSQAVEDLCYDYLQVTHCGWENNDGAFGEFRLNVAARTVELEFNGRYTAIDTENHTF
jgi:Family of unknown function (DUF6878)